MRHEAPSCASYSDERAVVAFERAVRVHRAHVEPFEVTDLGGGAHSVTSGSASEYVVDIVDGATLDTCTCPDFLGNRLGTCKHVEAVRRIVPGPVRPEGDVVTLRADGPLRVVTLGREHAGARVARAVPIARRMLDARAERDARTRAVAAALRDGTLDLDVLTTPLFPYQREGAAHLVRAGRAVLADDMGLGKTVQAIAACEVLRRRGEADRVVVVCPASLKAQWASEIAKYAGESAVVVTGGSRERRAALASRARWFVMNYEQTWRDALRSAPPADVLVLDEAQRARNFRTKTASTLKGIPSRFLFVLTGTPVENKLDDLYSLMQLVDAEALGPLWKFNVDFHRQDETGKVVGYKNLAALRRLLAPVVLRRRKAEVRCELPPSTEQVRYVPLSAEQAAIEAAHRRTAAALVAKAKQRRLSAIEQRRLAAALLKARQACNAARLADPESADGGSGKLDELAALVSEVVLQGSSKMLVFSEWVEMLKLAAARLDAMGVGYALLHGGVATERRPALLDAFRSDPTKVVLLSTDAGGVGLNLEDASYVVHLDLPWNPARVDQRIARAHRIGQTRGVSVVHLCAETGIERDVAATLDGKRAVRSAALDQASTVDELASAASSSGAGELLGAGQATESPHDCMDHARQRLRLARNMLDAGYPGDAVRAADEALSASLRWMTPPPRPSADDLVRPLARAAERGEPVDPAAAASAVDETARWIDEADRAALATRRTLRR